MAELTKDRPIGFSKIWAFGFELFLRPWMRHHLANLGCFGLDAVRREIIPGRSLVFVANHPGNWDAFLLRTLQRNLRPQASLFSLMRGDELEKRSWLRKIGAIGLAEGEGYRHHAWLRYLQEQIPREADFCMAYFPQGRLSPAWERPLQMRKGIFNLLRVLHPSQAIPIAIRYEYLEGLRPTALVSLGKVIASETLQSKRASEWVQGMAHQIEGLLEGLSQFTSEHLAGKDPAQPVWMRL